MKKLLVSAVCAATLHVMPSLAEPVHHYSEYNEYSYSEVYDYYTEDIDGMTWAYELTSSGVSLGYSVKRYDYDTMSGGYSSYTSCMSAIDSGTRGDLVIPSEINGHPVTSIGRSAFEGCTGLTSVTIPDSVTSIGDRVFYGCSGMTSVTIPDSVTSISSSAFYGCSGLTSVTIPDSVTSIGGGAFSGCSGLTTLAVNENNDCYKSVNGLLLTKDGLTLILVLGVNGNVTILDSVTSIGSSAFEGCSGLTSVTIPDSVTSIGDRAFYGCSGLTRVTIPDSVTSIGSSAFSGCTGLTSVTISDSVTSIGDRAFYGCSGLTSVTIPDSVTSIGSSAFEVCSGLTSVTIPDSVTSIGDRAFSGCSGLTSVAILNPGISISVPNYGSYDFYTYQSSFSGCNNVKKAIVPSKYRIMDLFPDLYSNLEEVAICEGSTGIVYEMFRNCSGLTSVTIPNSVTSIGDSAFYGCSGLTSVTIPDSVTSIGARAFYNCSSLMEVSLPASVESFGAACFDGVPGYARALYRAIFGGGTAPGGVAQSVSLTVTNVVVHYVTTAAASEAVTPPEDAGIVNVIAEVRADSKPVSVSSAWAEQYGEAFTAKFGTDFAAAVTAQTGKRDGAGNLMQVWQDYVAGTDPTDENDVFTASITFDEDGKPLIAYTPELSEAEAAKRKYTTYGKVKLSDKEWAVVPDGGEDAFNFFKVTVEMR